MHNFQGSILKQSNSQFAFFESAIAPTNHTHVHSLFIFLLKLIFQFLHIDN